MKIRVLSFVFRCGIVLCMLILPSMVYAQADALTWWGVLDIKKPLPKSWSIGVHSEWHQNVTNNQTDAWVTGPVVGKRFNNWLSASGGWLVLGIRSKGHDNVPSYYRPQQRPFLQFTASFRMGQIKASAREYWEWVYMPEVVRNDQLKSCVAYNQLRHRLKFEYLLPKSRFTPYVYTELRHYSVMEQFRVCAGTAYKLDKHNSFDFCYFYQDRRHKTNNHVFAVAYALSL